MADALERVTNLLALLLETRAPLTLEQIADRLGAYPANPAAMRGAFERDKAVLRDIGVPLDTEVLRGDQAGRTAYRIDRERYELAGLALTTQERQALQLAVAAIRSGDASFGLLKLGGSVVGDAPVVTNVPALDALPPLREAAAARAVVRFDYRGAVRELEPYSLLLREGFWYVIGHDRVRVGLRTFRVDRIDGPVTVGEPDEFVRPVGFDPRDAFPTDPKELGDAPATARVLVDAGRARLVVDELGDGAVVARRDDGLVELDVACANLDAFRSWVLGLGEHAEVLGPPVARAAVVDWLRGIAGARRDRAKRGRADVRATAREPGVEAARGRSPRSDGTNPGRGRGPRPVGERLRRLLVMLPWLMERGSVPVAEMASHFQVDEGELVRDLELAALCGLPPFVDEMIDVFIDEGMVHAGVPRVFTRPLRLTAPEGFALLIAGRAALAIPGADPTGPLARALDKLAAVLGEDGVVVESHQPPATAAVIAAANDGARLRVRYWTASRDETTERVLTPRTVFADRGNWYVIADDHLSGQERTFRVDRIESWEPTGAVDPPKFVAPPGPDDWFQDADLPVAVVRLAPSARWVAERYPVRGRREVGEAVEVELPITSERWLCALLLRLGPQAEVVEPAEWRSLGAAAAAAVLQRYESPASSARETSPASPARETSPASPARGTPPRSAVQGGG